MSELAATLLTGFVSVGIIIVLAWVSNKIGCCND